MCLFCESEAKKNRHHECFIFYDCDKCGKYIVAMSQIGRIRKSHIKIDLTNYRKNQDDENSILFIGNKESYDAYKTIVFKKYDTQTQSKFVDIDGLL